MQELDESIDHSSLGLDGMSMTFPLIIICSYVGFLMFNNPYTIEKRKCDKKSKEIIDSLINWIKSII